MTKSRVCGELKRNGIILMALQNVTEHLFTELLPPFCTVGASVSEPFDLNYGNLGVSILNTKKSEVDAYVSALEAAGCSLVTTREIVGNCFYTYLLTKGGEEYAVYLSYYPALTNFRVIWGKRGFLPSEYSAPASNGTRTSVIQIARDSAFGRLNFPDSAPGMGYVICLSDGAFILIDGGPRPGKIVPKHEENGEWVFDEPKDSGDLAALYELLVSRTPAGKKPVIAAWFFSHAHSDHVDLACEFLAKYKDAVEVRLGALNFPDFEKHPTDHEPNDHLQALAELTKARLIEAGAEFWTVHTGETISFPGCEVEILTTPEDYFPSHFRWGNHTSSAFRFTFTGKTFLALGDCEKDICQRLADNYGDTLKSDILQVTHHGVNGACTAVYKAIDPDYCLWPMDAYRFAVDERTRGVKRGYEFNAWLRNDEVKARKHYHNSESIEIFTDEK
jgi:glyoxylase-like metal-dependent hydrolase (beta-lactamase superfamily II)